MYIIKKRKKKKTIYCKVMLYKCDVFNMQMYISFFSIKSILLYYVLIHCRNDFDIEISYFAIITEINCIEKNCLKSHFFKKNINIYFHFISITCCEKSIYKIFLKIIIVFDVQSKLLRYILFKKKYN